MGRPALVARRRAAASLGRRGKGADCGEHAVGCRRQAVATPPGALGRTEGAAFPNWPLSRAVLSAALRAELSRAGTESAAE